MLYLSKNMKKQSFVDGVKDYSASHSVCCSRIILCATAQSGGMEIKMIYQPTLDRCAAQDLKISYRIRYRNEFTEIDDPRHDESHIHSCYEIYFNLAGDVSFWANNRLYPMKSGDLIVTRPGDVHLCVYNSATVNEHFCFWFDYGARSPLGAYFDELFDTNHYSLGEKKEKLAAMLRELKVMDEKGENEFLRTARLYEIFVFLRENCKIQNEALPETMPPEMQRIVDDLDKNFAELSHISDILKKYYISQATLNRWFRKYLRVSPREFLEAKKLAYAKKLLSEGHSVTETCMLAGFSDCSHFISVFKKKFGQTPHKQRELLFLREGNSTRK